MENQLHQNINAVGDWTLTGVILAVWLAAGFLVVRGLFSVFLRASHKAKFQFENMLVRALPVPLYVLLVITGVMFSSRFAPFLAVDEARIIGVLNVLLILAFVYLADKVIQGFVRDLEVRHGELRNSHVFFAALIHIAVWVMGLMIVLDHLGVSITPLLASLGVGSLAVALGFQNTFSNLFSGMYLLIDKPIEVGQFVRISTGEEGLVEAVGWRSTQIRTLDNHMVILPNSKLAENLVQNFSLPDPRCSLSVEVGVDLASDLALVERVTLEAAKQVQSTALGATRGNEPSLSFHTLGDYSLQFSVNLQADSYPAMAGVRHAFLKELLERYREAGIRLPHPIRTVEMREPKDR